MKKILEKIKNSSDKAEVLTLITELESGIKKIEDGLYMVERWSGEAYSTGDEIYSGINIIKSALDGPSVRVSLNNLFINCCIPIGIQTLLLKNKESLNTNGITLEEFFEGNLHIPKTHLCDNTEVISNIVNVENYLQSNEHIFYGCKEGFEDIKVIFE